LVVAALVLGCTDDGSKTTAPQLSGAVVRGASADQGGASNQGNAGERIDIALLSGDQEVPPRDTPANGRLSLKLNPDGNSVDYILEVKDISNITMAHIHMEKPGVNGSIIVWLFPSARANAVALPNGGGPVAHLVYEGTFSAADFRAPFAGQPLSVLLDAIANGAAYGNVHTNDGVGATNTGPGDFPGGEIRGDLHSHGH
jgi:hypothetical protein